MPRDWIRYLTNTRTDAGRALVEQGSRIDQARSTLTADDYHSVIVTAGITARDARLLSNIGRRIKPLLDHKPGLRLPIRIRTLAALSELSSDTLTREAEAGRIHSSMTEADARSLRGSTAVSVPQVIRPTDNWSFSKLQWPRIDGWEGHGYIPGDLYANCLWYYSHNGDTVIDPMAGSGMLLHVWEDRATWLDDEQLSLNPGFPILGVFRLKGQSKRDGSIIVRSCKASLSPVYPIRDAIPAVNHASCPSLSSSGPPPMG